MRITKRQLRHIIKEEKAKVLAEQRVRRIVRRRLMEQVDLDGLPWGYGLDEPEIKGVIDVANAAGARLHGEIVDEEMDVDIRDLDALGKAFKVQNSINHETEDASGTIEIGTINGESIAVWSVMGYSVWIR